AHFGARRDTAGYGRVAVSIKHHFTATFVMLVCAGLVASVRSISADEPPPRTFALVGKYLAACQTIVMRIQRTDRAKAEAAGYLPASQSLRLAIMNKPAIIIVTRGDGYD